MNRSQFGMTTSESFISVEPVKSDSSDGDLPSSLENASSIQTISSSNINSSFLDVSSEDTARWTNSLTRRKRSSLFADVKTLEEDGGCSVAYEYLCRLEELRRYLGTVLDVNPSLLPSTLAFEHQLSNGVWLCQLLAEVLPEKEITNAIFDPDHDTYKEEGLVFRHEHNIRLFLETISELSFPAVLMPTIEEVFENENRIKLVYTVQALAYYLKEIGLTNQKIDNLEKYLKFDEQVLLEIITMLETKGLDLPSFECLIALVDDELIYQQLKLKKNSPPPPSPSHSTSSQEKSYMTMKAKKEGCVDAGSDPEHYYSNQSMERKQRRSGTHGQDGEPIYEDADKFIKSESVVSLDRDPFEASIDPNSSTKTDPIPRRRKLSRGRMSAITGWNSAQLFMFPSRLEFNLFTCKERSIRVCMYTKPKIDMIIPTSPRKGVPLNLKPLLDKLKQAVVSNNTEEMMSILNNNHLELSPLDESKAQLYLDGLNQELEDSLNKCALAIYYGMKKVQSEKYLALGEQGSFLIRIGKKSPPTLSFSFRSKRGIKHFKIQYKCNKLSLRKRDVIRHEYSYVEDLIRELIDFLQDAHKLEMFSCTASDLSISPDLKDCNFFTSLSLDKVQFCINMINADIKKEELSIPHSHSWIPLKENPYTGLWGREMVIPVDRFASELLLIQYGTVGSYVVRPKGEGPMCDYVISIRTGTDVTHVKVVCTENGGYSLPDSSDVAPNLEQFVEVFTFKESQLANIGLKPVRIPSAKIEELKRKDVQHRSSSSESLLPESGNKTPGLKKGKSLENLLKGSPSNQFSHTTMVPSSNGYEGDTDTPEAVPPTPPSPFSPHKVMEAAASNIDLTNTVKISDLVAGTHERSVSLYGIKRTASIPKDSFQSVTSVPCFTESIDFFESLSSPILPQNTQDLESPLRQTPIQQRKSVVNTPLPPVPTYSPVPVNKLTNSLNQNFQGYDMSGSPPPVPYRPHALSMTNNVPDAYGDIRRQLRGKDGISPQSKRNKPRPLSIKLTRTIDEFPHPMPSSVSNMDFSTQFRSETDLSKFRKISTGSQPTKSHFAIERKISANLFYLTRPLPVLEDEPTPQITPEPDLESEEDLIDIDNWNIEEIGNWLEEIGLGQYQQTFSDNDIDGSVLSMLTNENLRDDIGIQSFGHRSKIIKQVKKLRK